MKPSNFYRWLFVLLFVCPLWAQKVEFKIKYLSANHVYLQGGSDDGLTVGDELVILRGQKEIGRVKVEYVSKYSASAIILKKLQPFKLSDRAKVVVKVKGSEKRLTEQKRDSTTVKTVTQQSVLPKRKKRTTKHMRIDGYISAQYYIFKDAGRQHLDFVQPTARFRLKIRNLWERSFHLEIRARSRYNQRSRSLNETVAQTEWQNRLYELTFSYDNPQVPINFKLGRIISNAFSGVGYIDGALLRFRLATHWYLGTFAGTQPDWRTSNFQMEIQKYGGYLKYERGSFARNKLSLLLAGVGAYHGATVSREFLYFQASYYHGRRWSVYHNLEVDVNRMWRKERAGQSLSLSGLYLTVNYNITSKITAGLSYDNRKNYYTYALRTLADSLFDDAFRHGLRAHFYLNAFKNYRISLNFGLREKSTDARYSYSYGIQLNRRNLFSRYNQISVRFAGFDNLFATGFNPNLTFSRYFWGGHYFNLSYGGYYYQIKNLSTTRLNQWLRLSSQLELPARFYLNGTYEYDWGDDIKGQRILMEIGYRF